MQVSDLKSFIRSGGYAWPGGYPCALLMADGEVIDAKAARENYRLIRRAMRDKTIHPSYRCSDWHPVDVFIHWEGEPLTCAHSGRSIEPAYAE